MRPICRYASWLPVFTLLSCASIPLLVRYERLDRAGMKAQMEAYGEWADEMEQRFYVFESALEDEAVAIMGSDFTAYERAEGILKSIESSLEEYFELVEVQARLVDDLDSGHARRSTVQQFSKNDYRLNQLRTVVQQRSDTFVQFLGDAGFYLIEPQDRIREMEEDVLRVSVKVREIEARIKERQAAVAQLLGVKGREKRLEELGRKLNEVDELRQEIQDKTGRLKSIIRGTRRELQDIDYYWIGMGFEEQRFDRAFRETHSQIESLIEDLELMLEE